MWNGAKHILERGNSTQCVWSAQADHFSKGGIPDIIEPHISGFSGVCVMILIAWVQNN